VIFLHLDDYNTEKNTDRKIICC